jgi:glutamate transport system permease protein
MAASVLFDQPGPVTRARHRLFTIAFAIVLALISAWVIYRLYEAGQFEAQIWERLFAPNVWREIRNGLKATLVAASLGIVGAVVLGFLLATARLSDHAWVRVPGIVLIEFFRAVPLLLLMIFLFFLIPEVIPGIQRETNALFAVVGGLTLYNGSVLAEVFRAGINAVPRGQSEAAYAIGMRKTQVMTIILTPQAVRFMLPAIISQCVVVLKDTSLGYIVTYVELLRSAKIIAEYVGSNLMTYLVVAVIYITLNSLVSAFATWLEARLARRGGGAAQTVKEIEDALPVG